MNCVSDVFTGEWDRFFQESVHTRAQPKLYQYLSLRLIFKELVKKQYAVCSDSCEVEPSPLTWEEENVLHYVGGYVCRKVHCKIKKLSLEHKETL